MSNFLPISKEEMLANGDYYCDFLLVTGDSYVDHPSFGIAIIARTIESLGFKVAILAQPNYKTTEDFEKFGKPRYATLITAGNIDSMVAHYTSSKKRRSDDDYTAGGKAGKRPDRAATVYAKLARKAFGDDMIIGLGGLEASLRRFAHYDYWSDKVMPTILMDSTADFLMFGMGETTIKELCQNFKAKKENVYKDLRGVAYRTGSLEEIKYPFLEIPSFEKVCEDKKAYALSAKIQYEQQDHVRGKALIQRHGKTYLVQNPPPIPLTTAQMDETYALPYERTYHPSYEKDGGVPSIREVEFSIIHNRGCFGACNFCALAFHQGRYISSRSHESVVAEAEQIAKNPNFKGYIHDVGGPTAQFRKPSCNKQKRHGLCSDKKCLAPTPCPALEADHSDYLSLLRKLRSVEGVKKVFVRSGIRFDYLMHDKKNDEFFAELVKHHISGQLKVAPEHISSNVLKYMGKPNFKVYEAFKEKYEKLNKKFGKNQFLVPYLMSSHPGSTLKDAIMLAQYLNKNGYMPEQVQDFYPTPGTISTAMYYTGINPLTMENVYVARTYEEKDMQRALLQWRRPDKRALVVKALKTAHREDLIGFSKDCLIRPEPGSKPTANAKRKEYIKAKPKTKRKK